MGENEIIKLYTTSIISMREIAIIFNTNHKLVSRILKRNNIPIRNGNKGKTLSNERKKQISESGKGRKFEGKKQSDIHIMKNMYSKLNRPSISFENILLYSNDIEKLKFLNRSISKYRVQFDDNKYINYIEKFWNCKQFNKIYNKWLDSNKAKWLKPSVDHIIPTSLGGSFELSNLQFLSWFENRAKVDMLMDEWNFIKKNLKDYLIDEY